MYRRVQPHYVQGSDPTRKVGSFFVCFSIRNETCGKLEVNRFTCEEKIFLDGGKIPALNRNCTTRRNMVPNSPNISMKDAQNRLRDRQCLNCGRPETNTELNSCNRKECVKVLRPVYHWTRKVAGFFQDDNTRVYIG